MMIAHRKNRIGMGVKAAVAAFALSGAAFQTQAQKTGAAKTYVAPPVELVRLPARLKLAVLHVGDRLTRTDKEQTTAVGTIQRGKAVAAPLVVIAEPQGKIRVTAGGKVLGADGTQTWAGAGTPDDSDDGLLETLLNDSFDHLVSVQSAGAIRFLGARFRTGYGKAPDSRSPYYDIYELDDSVLPSQSVLPAQSALPAQKATTRHKTFLVNSDTGFLERVIYSVPSGKASLVVQTVLSGWKTVNGQSWPSSITRFENGVAVLSIQYSTVSFAAASATDIFRSAIQ